MRTTTTTITTSIQHALYGSRLEILPPPSPCDASLFCSPGSAKEGCRDYALRPEADRRSRREGGALADRDWHRVLRLRRAAPYHARGHRVDRPAAPFEARSIQQEAIVQVAVVAVA